MTAAARGACLQRGISALRNNLLLQRRISTVNIDHRDARQWSRYNADVRAWEIMNPSTNGIQARAALPFREAGNERLFPVLSANRYRGKANTPQCFSS